MHTGQMQLSGALMGHLICPACGQILSQDGGGLRCGGCGAAYPVVDGVPVLLHQQGSVFSAERADRLEDHVFSRTLAPGRSLVRALVPKSATNLYAAKALSLMAEALHGRAGARPAVLVIGAGEGGESLDVLTGDPEVEVVRSDVIRGPHVSVVLDAHNIPFESATFDGVVAQAVLEHVLDPVRCVAEIRRVLRPGGLVYVETPFMQQVHGGRYDFTRFTYLGHRRLLRGFEEIDSGIVAGPGAALAWAWEYFLMSFCRTGRSRAAVRAVGRLTSFYLKYFDRRLTDRPGAYDAASAFGFLGTKAPEGSELSDADLLASYPGLIP